MQGSSCCWWEHLGTHNKRQMQWAILIMIISWKTCLYFFVASNRTAYMSGWEALVLYKRHVSTSWAKCRWLARLTSSRRCYQWERVVSERSHVLHAADAAALSRVPSENAFIHNIGPWKFLVNVCQRWACLFSIVLEPCILHIYQHVRDGCLCTSVRGAGGGGKVCPPTRCATL